MANARLSERDLDVLRFAAEHRLVLSDQVRALLGISAAAAQARLRALVRARLLVREPIFAGKPACFQITRSGLGLIGSQLSPPRLDLHTYDHDISLAWLWLAARRGSFGPLGEVVSERQLRSCDARRDQLATPAGVRLAGTGRGGRPRLHYPDLLLRTDSGHWVAVELELTSKTRSRRETILMGYAGDRRFDAVLYLVEQKAIGREIAIGAEKLGISDMVQVQLVSLGDSSPARGRVRSRERTNARAEDRRTPEREIRAR